MERKDILYKYISKPIWDMAMMYESSALFVDNNLNSPKVIKAFKALKEVLTEQAEKLKK